MPKFLVLWVALGLTVATWSFLYKMNFWYRLAEHIFVGIGAAHFFVVVWSGTLVPNLIEPLAKGEYMLLIPALLGIMYLARLLPPKYVWASRYPMALSMGVGAGVGVRSVIQGTLFPQISSMLKPLNSIDSIIVFVAVLSSMFYFLFSFPLKGPAQSINKFGRYVLMIYFGLVYGQGVMAQLSYLLGRLQFVFYDVFGVVP